MQCEKGFFLLAPLSKSEERQLTNTNAMHNSNVHTTKSQLVGCWLLAGSWHCWLLDGSWHCWLLAACLAYDCCCSAGCLLALLAGCRLHAGSVGCLLAAGCFRDAYPASPPFVASVVQWCVFLTLVHAVTVTVTETGERFRWFRCH